LQDARMKANTT